MISGLCGMCQYTFHKLEIGDGNININCWRTCKIYHINALNFSGMALHDRLGRTSIEIGFLAVLGVNVPSTVKIKLCLDGSSNVIPG